MNEIKRLLLIGAAAAVLSGCGQAEEADRAVELQAEEVREVSYELTPVTRGDVQQPLVIDCNYLQTVEMDLFFAVDQEIVTDVYVEKGDMVEKGDLLVSVNVEDMEKQIAELEHQLDRARLSLQQLQENREFDLEQADILFSYTSMTDGDKKALKEQKESIEKSYKNRLEDAADSVEMLEARLENAREYMENGRLYAPMDGVISYVKKDLEGSATDSTERVISLYDAESCMFISENTEAVPYIDPAEEYTIVCGLGNSQREYAVAPANTENWGEQIYFRLLEEEYDPNIIKNGKISIITEEAEGVLCVERTAVHVSDEKYYVYLLDEEGIRRMKFVETGLWGSDLVEIRSGLEEGDYVIR